MGSEARKPATGLPRRQRKAFRPATSRRLVRERMVHIDTPVVHSPSRFRGAGFRTLQTLPSRLPSTRSVPRSSDECRHQTHYAQARPESWVRAVRHAQFVRESRSAASRNRADGTNPGRSASAGDIRSK